MKTNMVRISYLVSMCILLAGALGPAGVAAEEAGPSTVEVTTEATAEPGPACLTIYPSEPGAYVDFEGCKELVPPPPDGGF